MTREEWKNLRKERGMTLYTRKQKSSGWLAWELDGVFKSAAILRRKENIKACWADVGTFIHGLREVNGENGTVVGGYFDRADMDALKEKIKEIEILMADEWRLR